MADTVIATKAASLEALLQRFGAAFVTQAHSPAAATAGPKYRRGA